MGIHFDWQATDDEGRWTPIAAPARRSLWGWLRRVPRWVWWVSLAVTVTASMCAGGILWYRYNRASRRMTFQIQSVIDLEARAFARGDVELFLAQQDESSSPEWYASRRALAESARAGTNALAVLPAQVQQVNLQGNTAWVEVIEGSDPVRRMRFYRQSERGWLHTAPDPAFWGLHVVYKYGDQLVFHYLQRDAPYVSSLVERLGGTFYEVCADLGCPQDEVLEVSFDTGWPILSPATNHLGLVSPWISGIPVDGDWSEMQWPGAARALVGRAASISFRGLYSLYDVYSRYPTFASAILDEYAAWISTEDLAQAPLLRQVIARHGEDVLPEVFALLRPVHPQQGGVPQDFVQRWLGLVPERNEVAYFQALLDLEGAALRAGRRGTFMVVQDGANRQWLEDRMALFRRIVASDQASFLPPVHVEAVEISDHRAQVILALSGMPPGAPDSWPSSPVFFRRLQNGTWVHTPPPYAPFTDWSAAMFHEPSPTPGTGDVITVTFACYQCRTFDTWVDVFHEYYGEPGVWVSESPGLQRRESYPGIRVELVDIEEIVELARIPWDDGWGRKVRAQIASGADTSNMGPIQAVTREGWVIDLSPFIQADKGFAVEDFRPNMIERFQWDDGIWALPAENTVELIFYDKDAFDAAGVSYPRPGWTQEEFLQVTHALTRREGEADPRYGFIAPQGHGYEFVLARIGVQDEPAGLAVPDLTAPEVVEAVRWYTDLALRHGVMPNPEQVSSILGGDNPALALWSLIHLKKGAMWVDSLGNWEDLRKAFDLGVAPLPVGQQQVHIWSAESYFMSRYTQHPDASWAWLRFLTYQRRCDRASATWVSSNSISDTAITTVSCTFSQYLPVRRSVAEATGYWTQGDPETTATIQYVLEHGTVLREDASTAALAGAIQAVFGGKPVEEALAEAQARLDREMQASEP